MILFTSLVDDRQGPVDLKAEVLNARNIGIMLSNDGCLTIAATLQGSADCLEDVCRLINDDAELDVEAHTAMCAEMAPMDGFNHPVIRVYKGSIVDQRSYVLVEDAHDAVALAGKTITAKWKLNPVQHLPPRVDITLEISETVPETEIAVNSVTVPDLDGDAIVTYAAPVTPGDYTIKFTLWVGKKQLRPTLTHRVTVVESLTPPPLFRSGSHLQLVYNMTPVE
jgi:hypothetical protein